MRTICSAVALIFAQSLCALPGILSVSEGEASVAMQSIQEMEISASDGAVLDWGSFSIGADEIVRFLQPDAAALAVNRVMSQEISSLLGRLEANGRVVLLNPNGILVGQGAVIDTGSFVAAAFDHLENFRSGHLEFGAGRIQSEGMIFARAGDAAFAAGRIEQSGRIEALRGEVLFRAGEEIENSGAIAAPRITFLSSGTVSVAGELTALAGGKGGKIHILGNVNHIFRPARINASGPMGGGEILIGGDFRGKNPLIPRSRRTFIDAGASVYADASLNGNGGRVIVWSDEATISSGFLSAEGGVQGGDGGLIEISSKGLLSPLGRTSTLAPLGRTGLLFLDPCAVTISNAGDMNATYSAMTQDYAFSGAAANIDVTALGMHLQSNNVTIDAASGGGTAPSGSISLLPGLGNTLIWDSSMTPPNLPTKLTLIADGFIDIQNVIFSQHLSAAPGEVVIEINAPVVTIGEPTLMLANSAQLIAATGQVQVNASTSLTIYGNAASSGGIQAGSLMMPVQVGSISINTGSFYLESGSAFTSVVAYGDISIDAGGDIEFHAGTAPGGLLMADPAGTIFIRGGGDLTLEGGSGAGSAAGAIIALSGGTVDIAMDGDYILQGGTSTGDGNTGISINGGTGSVTVSGRNIYLNAGTAPAATAIAAIGIVAPASGDVTVTATGSDGIVATAQGGSGAGILNLGGVSTDLISITTTHLQLFGSNTPGAMNVGGLILAGAADLSIQASGDLIMTAGGGAGGNTAAIQKGGTGSVAVSARNAFLTGGSSPGSFAFIANDAGSVTIDLSGDCVLNGGSALSTFAALVASFSGGSGNLTLQARNLSVTGGSGDNAIAGLFTGDITMGMGGGDGAISVSLFGTNGASLTGGAGAGATARIETLGSSTANAISISALHPSANLSLATGSGMGSNAAIHTLSGGAIDLAVGHDIVLQDAAGSLASIEMGAGGAGDLFISAGHSLSINSSVLNLGSGNLFIVVDAAFPSSPLFGSGSLSLGPSGIISAAGGLVRIWSAQQGLNTISGLINGVSFDRGTLFINSDQEVWCTYYPSGTGTSPLIFFYKDCLQELVFQASVIDSEALEDLHPSNENPGWFARFYLQGGGLGDPELSVREPYLIRRRILKTIDQPKTYTAW